MATSEFHLQRHRSIVHSAFSKRKRSAVLFAAGASIFLIGHARADTYYFHTTLNNADWDSTADDITVGSTQPRTN